MKNISILLALSCLPLFGQLPTPYYPVGPSEIMNATQLQGIAICTGTPTDTQLLTFTSAMRELKQLQKERQARPQQPPAQPKETAQPAQAPSQPHVYVMSEGTENHPVFCAPGTTDSR